jgi:hypothetical protein
VSKAPGAAKRPQISGEISETDGVKAFERAAAAYLEKGASSRDVARKTLIRLGFMKKNGGLTKTYR